MVDGFHLMMNGTQEEKLKFLFDICDANGMLNSYVHVKLTFVPVALGGKTFPKGGGATKISFLCTYCTEAWCSVQQHVQCTLCIWYGIC
ncbi:hypothetical protein HOLleu_19860 [Holothuria leucospilota]|uniref:Uncharacterized protein n=1 Tax=Holothuria leucospilota TaxID=206669 RepID=A0A9Q1C0G9_HOLLE|nr:hypothetical protein HOLleu_19860 [Holothuria leucospilota]